MLRAARNSILLISVAALLFASSAMAAPKRCQSIGGTLLTNIGGFGPNTTLGVMTGDIRGAVGVEILGITQGANGTTMMTVNHHLVTDNGDTVYIDQAKVVGLFVTETVLAITDYQVHISGGTGRFEGVTGDMSVIGEGDFATGHLAGRYMGSVCKGPGEEW